MGQFVIIGLLTAGGKTLVQLVDKHGALQLYWGASNCLAPVLPQRDAYGALPDPVTRLKREGRKKEGMYSQREGKEKGKQGKACALGPN